MLPVRHSPPDLVDRHPLSAMGALDQLRRMLDVPSGAVDHIPSRAMHRIRSLCARSRHCERHLDKSRYAVHTLNLELPR